MANIETLGPAWQKGQSGGGNRKGKRNRSTIAKKVLHLKMTTDLLPEKKKAQFEAIIAALGLKEDDLDAETLSYIGQVVKSITRLDTPAHTGLMDSAYGKPAQPIEFPEQEQIRYDLDRLTEEENAELDAIEERRAVLLAKAALPTESDSQEEG